MSCYRSAELPINAAASVTPMVVLSSMVTTWSTRPKGVELHLCMINSQCLNVKCFQM